MGDHPTFKLKELFNETGVEGWNLVADYEMISVDRIDREVVGAKCYKVVDRVSVWMGIFKYYMLYLFYNNQYYKFPDFIFGRP